MRSWQTRELFVPTDHPSAAGHFPGCPIIPGALLLDALVESIAGEVPVTLKMVKFLRPISHGTKMELRWQRDGGGRVRFECLVEGEPAVTGSLECHGAPA